MGEEVKTKIEIISYPEQSYPAEMMEDGKPYTEPAYSLVQIDFSTESKGHLGRAFVTWNDLKGLLKDKNLI